MREKLGDSLWGLAFIAVGIGLIGNIFHLWDFRLFFHGWWTLFIIIPSIISMVKNGVKTRNLIGLIIGILLFIDANGFLLGYFIRKLIFPGILILIGLSIIFKNNSKIDIKENNVGKDGYLSLSSVCSNHEVRPSNEVIRGGAISAVFGNIQLDLRSSIIEENIKINVTSIMGKVDIFVPSNVNVKVSSTPIFGFGSISNRTLQNNLDSCPVIYINATCIFGGVDIK
ncbi:cell wall-active antibiotics response protein [Clostridium sp. SHJSY1]|uniref:LiaF transmembrane domain-containing protein n=1 Tax=Clostridium sp. SHJSY1 TaxID=2942483 RepID=UPI002875DE3E|nr:LiaF domain-containing protein [Clostridium sp. SHJSY1]MDS0525226.1 cell wall-active antibiotics response protein [Clostridium sp. SHJSY1]